VGPAEATLAGFVEDADQVYDGIASLQCPLQGVGGEYIDLSDLTSRDQLEVAVAMRVARQDAAFHPLSRQSAGDVAADESASS